ncbi:hypothetical protein N7470_010136, partial [Penicillium chermesinum]
DNRLRTLSRPHLVPDKPQYAASYNISRDSAPENQWLRKTERLTPSTYLSESLEIMGYALGARPGGASNEFGISDFQTKYRIKDGRSVVRESLQTILADFIQHLAPLLSVNLDVASRHNELDSAIAHVFSRDRIRFLSERGYDVEDVISWAWIVTSESTARAVSRLFVLEADTRARRGPDAPGVPGFITLFLLRKHLDINSNTFRLLLIHSLHLITGSPLPTLEAAPSSELVQKDALETFGPKITVMTCSQLVYRLIFHARQWDGRGDMQPVRREAKTGLAETRLNKLKTKLFNEGLWLLSYPSRTYPFRSMFLHQRAQFELLGVMASHKPVLPIMRTGYRGVAAVQLAHKKTSAERQSAELKAPSWPPWKEERLGIDSQRGNEGIHSRAISILSQMTEAGYSHRLWEDFNRILAGWDTDSSPTVQTRTMVSRARSLLNSGYEVNDPRLWPARIRATRTVREAWACFLSYQTLSLESTEAAYPTEAAYAAMAERLIRGRKLAWSEPNDHSDSLPGDGPETYPEPSSARDIIYVQTEPPTPEVFLEEMRSQGIPFSGALLALLLQTAPTFQAGLDYLRNSDLTDKQVAALCTIWQHGWQYRRHSVNAIEGIPGFIFASFIHFLCRYSEMSIHTLAREVFTPFRPQSLINARRRHGVADSYRELPRGAPVCVLSDLPADLPLKYYPGLFYHAIHLLRSSPSLSPQAWRNLIGTFEYTRMFRQRRTDEGKCLYRIIVWYATVEILGWMQSQNLGTDPEMFHNLCRAFTRAVVAGTKYPHLLSTASELRHQGSTLSENSGSLESLVDNGLFLLKKKFDSLVLPNREISSVAQRSVFTTDDLEETYFDEPTLFHTPFYSTLHAFVRALGTAGDDAGLVELLGWMSQVSASLDELADERRNGLWMREQTLQAIRLYLERPDNPSSDSDPAKVKEAYDIISRTPGWTWPSDEEIESYLSRSS